MKKTALALGLLLCLTPVNALGMGFPIAPEADGNPRSYEYEMKQDAIVYEIDMGAREQTNRTRIPVETIDDLKAEGISQIEVELPWISGTLDLAALSIPADNEAVLMTVAGVEPAGVMRSVWRRYRPAKLVDPFTLDLDAEYTHISLAPGTAGIPRPDPAPISGAALGFITKIRYSYGRDRLRVLRWNGSDFADIPSENWDVFTEDGVTYVEGFRLEPGIYTLIDGQSL